jgi:polyisoprenoid-binding protein YceI
MRRITTACLFIFCSLPALAFTVSGPGKTENTLTVNTEKSRVDWTGSKKNDFHTGYFPLKTGQLTLTDGKLTGGTFVIDIANLKVTDAGGGDRLAGHLKTADFFSADKFGEATYTITAVKYTDDNSADVTGNLTLKGITLPVNFPVKIRNADEKGFFAQAFFPLDRTLFGVNYGIGAVSKDVEIAVHLFAK